MKQCPKCGNNCDDNLAYCSNCGNALTASGTAAAPAGAAEPDGELKKYFQTLFAGFDAGRSPCSWNWPAAIFELIWYAVKGMWPKVVLYGAGWWALDKALLFLDLNSLSSFLWLAMIVYLGAAANYDYYLYKRKAEHFWPGLPYNKLKIPFWTAIIVLALYSLFFQGMALTKALTAFARDAKPEPITSFADGKLRFSGVPDQWVVYKDPPDSFALKVSRPAGDGSTISLKYSALAGTKFMGYIAQGEGKDTAFKGLVALVENTPRFGGKFASPGDEAVVKKAKQAAGIEKMPFYMKWVSRWMSSNPADIEHLEFSGYKWERLKNEMELNFSGSKNTFYINVYWTVAEGKAVYVISEAFEPYKDEIRAQVEGFLASFIIGDRAAAAPAAPTIAGQGQTPAASAAGGGNASSPADKMSAAEYPVIDLAARMWARRIQDKEFTAEQLEGYSRNWIASENYKKDLFIRIRRLLAAGPVQPLTREESERLNEAAERSMAIPGENAPAAKAAPDLPDGEDENHIYQQVSDILDPVIDLNARMWAARIQEGEFTEQTLKKNSSRWIATESYKKDLFGRIRRLLDEGTVTPLTAKERARADAANKKVRALLNKKS